MKSKYWWYEIPSNLKIIRASFVESPIANSITPNQIDVSPNRTIRFDLPFEIKRTSFHSKFEECPCKFYHLPETISFKKEKKKDSKLETQNVSNNVIAFQNPNGCHIIHLV